MYSFGEQVAEGIFLKIEADNRPPSFLYVDCVHKSLDTEQVAGTGKQNRIAVLVDCVVFHRVCGICCEKVLGKHSIECLSYIQVTQNRKKTFSLMIVREIIKMLIPTVKQEIFFVARLPGTFLPQAP